MKLKKLTAIILAGALMTCAMMAWANDNEVVLDGTIDHDLGVQAEGEYGIMLIDEAPIEAAPTYVNISGTIVEVIKSEEGTVSSILVDKGEGMEALLHISEETVAVDVNGMPINLAELEAGTLVDVAQGAAQTMSIPPQATAIAVIVKAEDEIAPKYIEIKSISEEDGKLAFESVDGYYLIAVDDATEFVPFRTRNIVTAKDLKEGSKVLVWYGISTKSIPEKALATKVMILPEAIVVEGEAPEKELIITGAEIAGKVIDFAKYDNVIPEVKDGVTFLPIRAIAETAGAVVSWDAATQGITIEAEGVKAELKIGVEVAVVGGENVVLASAPKIVDGRTVVGVSVDIDKYGLKLITEEK